jgi:alkanesulfonate monooxygenase SsuD/methylene tetrahydromethanopterin reductase-like flavin-dependent oxidoreductase (luciferase family)
MIREGGNARREQRMEPDQAKLQVGIILPVFEGDLDGRTPRWVDLAALARRAEEIGVDSLWVVDHLLSVRAEREGGSRQGPWECWSVLAALAAVTRRVKLGPLVSSTGFRNPALLAKMAATLDEISGGRLILGLGAGWHEPEFAAFGLPFDHRFARLDEALRIIGPLVREGYVDFQGTFHSARDCVLRPRRAPGSSAPPIMLGTNVAGERMLDLIARHADIWNAWTVWGRNRPDEVPALRARVDAACLAIGRDPASLARSVAIQIDLPGFVPRPDSKVNAFTGSPEELAAFLRAYAAEGIGHVQVWLQPTSLAGIEQFAAVLTALA